MNVPPTMEVVHTFAQTLEMDLSARASRPIQTIQTRGAGRTQSGDSATMDSTAMTSTNAPMLRSSTSDALHLESV